MDHPDLATLAVISQRIRSFISLFDLAAIFKCEPQIGLDAITDLYLFQKVGASSAVQYECFVPDTNDIGELIFGQNDSSVGFEFNGSG